MARVLMVCLGNICRSPLAEGILRAKARQLNLPIEIDSCGTAGYHIGETPDPRSVEKAAEYDIDIRSLRGRQIEARDLERFDYILVMDRHNRRDVLQLPNAEKYSDKVRLILDYTPQALQSEVPDPYYGGPDGFEHVYQLLDQALDAFIRSEMPASATSS